MKLTDFQKQVVRDIAAGKITTVESFLEVTYKPKGATAPPGNAIIFNFQGRNRYVDSGTAGWLFDDIDKVREGLRVFAALWARLENARLIATVTTVDRFLTSTPVFKKVPAQNQMDIHRDVMSIIQQNAATTIQKLPDLDDFVANDFLTAEELEKRQALEAAKKSQRTTNLLAVTTIILGIVTAVGTTWFNYKTYTTDRTVIIKNLNDTQKVLIVNPSAITSLGNTNPAAAVQPAK